MTFSDAWRRVLLHAPAVPPTLAQDWVQKAYNRVLDFRPWAFLRARGTIATENQRIVACTTTLDSNTVTAVPGTFLATDVNRQFRVSSYPIYTITTVAAGGGSCTLDVPFGDTTALGAVNATIITAFFTAPADFAKFKLIADPYNQRRLPWWITEEQLNILDPIRRASDPSPRLLCSYQLSQTPTTLGQPVYEVWPYATSQRRYPFLYFKKAATLQDDDNFLPPFSARPDIFATAGLVEAAMWPGTTQEKNGYYNLALAKAQRDQFLIDLNYLSQRDDEIFMEDYETVNWSRWPLAGGYDTHLLRSTDADINNYWAL